MTFPVVAQKSLEVSSARIRLSVVCLQFKHVCNANTLCIDIYRLCPKQGCPTFGIHIKADRRREAVGQDHQNALLSHHPKKAGSLLPPEDGDESKKIVVTVHHRKFIYNEM